jgi:cellobiose phosphorylase
MDLRPFIDQGVWVISTIVTYLKYTGDFEFLKEDCGYYEIIDEKRKLVKKIPVRDSVLEHMLKIMNYLITNRDHEITKCVRALYGDWNDALDGLGVSLDPEKEYGSGVSVMVSLQVYQNLMEMEELLGKLDSSKFSSLISEYAKVRSEIKDGLNKYAVLAGENSKKRIVHGWGDKVSYYVGSFDDPDHKSRHGLTSNAFWVLSGLYDEDMGLRNTIMEAFASLDSKYGMKTFEPHFEPDAKGVGRIPKLPAGTAENGAAYIHASLFGVMAMFRMGYSEEAWNQLIKSVPFTHESVSCSPYIMPNSYGFNQEKNIDGQSMADWQTGSSNVLLKLLVKYVFGLSPEYDGIWIQPAAYIPFECFEFQIKIKNCNVNIIYKEIYKAGRKFYVNKQQRSGVFYDVMKLEKVWITEKELNCHDISIEIID